MPLITYSIAYCLAVCTRTLCTLTACTVFWAVTFCRTRTYNVIIWSVFQT